MLFVPRDFFRMERIRERYRYVKKRDSELIHSVDMKKIDRLLRISLYFLLSFFVLDVITTLTAKAMFPSFVEKNVIVAPLLGVGFAGFLFALAIKYLPILPIALILHLRHDKTQHPTAIRVIKLGGLAGILAGNFLYTMILANNLAHLVAAFI